MENQNEYYYIVNLLSVGFFLSVSILLLNRLIYAGWVKFWIRKRKRHADKLAELMKSKND